MLFKEGDVVKIDGLYRKVVCANDEFAFMATMSRALDNANEIVIDMYSTIAYSNEDEDELPDYEIIDNFEHWEADLQSVISEKFELLAYKLANMVLPANASVADIEQEKEHILEVFKAYQRVLRWEVGDDE
jgi:hypothetical protein